jgi:hypothetical protein
MEKMDRSGLGGCHEGSREWNKFIKGGNKIMVYILTNLSNHLNGKIRSKKVGTQGVLTEEKDAIVIAWRLVMQTFGQSITLQ